MGVWLVVLSSSELGLVYPIFTGGATLLVMLVSALALGEKLERRRLLGALLILAGIFVAHLE
jgi:multidrug transporter EmrE-like cation transporter